MYVNCWINGDKCLDKWMHFGPLRYHQAHPTNSSYVEVNSTGHWIIKGIEGIINKNKLKKIKSLQSGWPEDQRWIFLRWEKVYTV